MNLQLPKAQFPAQGSQQVAGGAGGRGKVALKPGRSLMDWIRLGKSGKDLTGVGGRILKVTEEELAKHNTPDDCWIALRGKVYNITDYMEYHPGGEDELLRGGGIDGTVLFDEVHKWVNYESMLAKCLVGRLVDSPTIQAKPESGRRRASSTLSYGLAPPSPVKLAAPEGKPAPRYDWIQSNKNVTITIYTKWKDIQHEHVIIQKEDKVFTVIARIEDYTYKIKLVKVSNTSGKADIVLEKIEQIQWSSIGTPLDGDKSWKNSIETDIEHFSSKLVSKSEVTHDTSLYCFALPPGCRMCVPVGHHIHATADIEGMAITRSYTVVPPSLCNTKQDERVTNGEVFYLMIKHYEQGALTPHLSQLNINDSLIVSHYDGKFRLSQLKNCKNLIMCAAGTGFTPMAYLIYIATVLEPQNYETVKLLLFNKTERDIPWRDDLLKLTETIASFQVIHVLSEADDSWKGPKGRICKNLLDDLVPKQNDTNNTLFCACGPNAFTHEAIRLATEDFHFKDEFVHAFLG